MSVADEIGTPSGELPNIQQMSMSSEEDQMNLNKLPADVMRMIMKMESSAIESMRLVSTFHRCRFL